MHTSAQLAIEPNDLLGVPDDPCGSAEAWSYSLRCLGCDASQDDNGLPVADFLERLNADGWRREDASYRILCPACVADAPRRISMKDCTALGARNREPFILTCTECQCTEQIGNSRFNAALEYTSRGWRRTNQSVFCPACASASAKKELLVLAER